MKKLSELKPQGSSKERTQSLKLSELKVGPELDALVAEHVMGWTNLGEEQNINFSNGRRAIWTDNKTKYVGLSLPRYSTDIACAWQVVEKLINDFPQWDVQVIYNCEGSWLVNLYHTSPPDQEGEYAFAEESSTAPHAICLAALRACGYGEEKEPKK